MVEKPILMCGDMVRAIMREKNPKRMTRRLINPQPQLRYDGYLNWSKYKGRYFSEVELAGWARYQPGDVLWTRETWAVQDCRDCTSEDDPNTGAFCQCNNTGGADCCIRYRADGLDYHIKKWQPSIFMPRNAARLFLEVTNVRAERLQDISEADAIAEGIEYKPGGGGSLEWYLLRDGGWWNFATHKEAFAALWDGLNAKRYDGAAAWAVNPWVWVYTFERMRWMEART